MPAQGISAKAKWPSEQQVDIYLQTLHFPRSAPSCDTGHADRDSPPALRRLALGDRALALCPAASASCAVTPRFISGGILFTVLSAWPLLPSDCSLFFNRVFTSSLYFPRDRCDRFLSATPAESSSRTSGVQVQGWSSRRLCCAQCPRGWGAQLLSPKPHPRNSLKVSLH